MGREVHEIKLNDEFLMSSLFTVAEEELARLALAELGGPELGGLELGGPELDALELGGSELDAPEFDVVVGGLGLGYTAQAVLEHPAVRRLVVVDALAEVIEWHERGLIPAGAALAADPRCALVPGDFFALLRSGAGFDPAAEATGRDRLWDAIVVDIDHSPRHHLHPSHADLYEAAGLRRLGARLRPGGVFALWSNDPPDEEFTQTLADCFAQARAEVVRFPNPLQQREATATIYLATT